MTPKELQQASAQLGLDLTAAQLDQFKAYYDLLVAWNEKMNLTAITDAGEVYLKHFYDSLTLMAAYPLAGHLRLVDVGAGAGFPSLPLKIACPDLEVTIVDSLKKRLTFLEALVKELGLTGVSLHHARAEDFGQNKKYRGQFDLVTARAVARLSVLAEYCLPLAQKGGTFVARKGSQGQEELLEAKHAIATLGGKVAEVKTLELPGEEGQREILVIQKTKETPNKYPRKAGTPHKKPL